VNYHSNLVEKILRLEAPNGTTRFHCIRPANNFANGVFGNKQTGAWKLVVKHWHHLLETKQLEEKKK